MADKKRKGEKVSTTLEDFFTVPRWQLKPKKKHWKRGDSKESPTAFGDAIADADGRAE